MCWRFLFTDVRVNRGPMVAPQPATRVPLGKWIHVTAVWDVDAGRMSLAFDGKTLAEATFAPEDPPDLKALIAQCPPHNLLIGAETGSNPTARLDDLRISDVDRTPASAPARLEPVILSSYQCGPLSDYVPTRAVVTPHVPWATNLPGGPIKGLFIPSVAQGRE